MDSKDQDMQVTSEPTKKPTLWVALLLFAISLGRIGSGLFISIHGPTLLTLANNVGVSVGDVSWLFSGRSLGVLAGGIITGAIMRKLSNMYSFAGASFILAAVITATPWITDLWLLILVVLVGGIVFGYLDAGMQALILQIWGEKESRGLISGYHFMIAVGAFLAPVLAQPFLTQTAEDVCPAKDDPTITTTSGADLITQTIASLQTTNSAADELNPIVWAYLICGGFLVFVGLVFVVLGCLRTEERIREGQEEIIESRDEDSPRSVAFLFALVCVYYFFCVAGETAYNSYIYSVSICSDLQFSVTNGTMVNALFWIGFGSGRLAGVLILRYIKPSHVILADMAGTIVTMVIVCIFGESNAAVTWAVTFLYSFFQATVYPAGVSWTSQYTNMSGNYIFVFSAGQALGTMVLLPVGGAIFDVDPFSVMFLILGCSVMNAISFGLMLLEGRRIKKRKSLLDSGHDNQVSEKGRSSQL